MDLPVGKPRSFFFFFLIRFEFLVGMKVVIGTPMQTQGGLLVFEAAAVFLLRSNVEPGGAACNTASGHWQEAGIRHGAWSVCMLCRQLCMLLVQHLMQFNATGLADHGHSCRSILPTAAHRCQSGVQRWMMCQARAEDGPSQPTCSQSIRASPGRIGGGSSSGKMNHPCPALWNG